MGSIEWRAFEELQGVITQLHSEGSSNPNQLKALELRLIRLRPLLGRVGVESEAKSAERRKDISTGNVGNGARANAAFVRDALLVSDLLGMSETRAVSLMRHALDADTASLYPDRAPIECAVREYQRERLALAECLDLMLKTASSSNLSQHVRRVCSHHLSLILADSNFTASILASLADLAAHIDSLANDNSANPKFVTGSQLKSMGVSEAILQTTSLGAAKIRLALSALLISLARYASMSFADVVQLTTLVQTCTDTDPVWAALSTACIAGIQGLPTTVELTSDQMQLVTKQNTMIFGQTNAVSKWAIKGLQETIAVQFCLFLRQARQATPRLEENLGYHESLEAKLSRTLSSSPPFEFMKDRLVAWSTLDANPQQPVIDVVMEADVRDDILSVLQNLMTGLFKNLSRCVRTLKNEAEDLEVAAAAASAGTSTNVPSGLKQLLQLVYALFKDRPDAGLSFWTDPDLFKFCRFMMDVRSGSLLQAYLDVLSALATGPQSAQYAAEFMSGQHARLSWEALFRSLDFTAKSLAAHPDGEMHPDEVNLQRSFLRLLKQVVRFSQVARTALYSSAHLQVINTLFNLLNRRISVEHKASILEAIAAFAIPADKGSLSDVSPMIWRHLEQAEVVSRAQYTSGFHFGTFGGSATSSGGANGGGSAGSGRAEGIRFDLEQIESQNQTYPETTSFMLLLNTLLFAIKPNQVTGAVDAFSTRLQTQGGVIHYIHFAVEEVFLKMHNRAFNSVDEKWRMIELCLNLFDQCLKSFELMYASGESYDNPAFAQLRADAASVSVEAAQTVLVTLHPGFSLMLRILSGSPFLKRLFELACIDVDVVNQFGRKCQPLAASVKLCLRILLRAFHLQKFVTDVIAQDAGSFLKNTPSVTGMDQLLAFYKDTVVKIALFINCEIDDEICLLSVNLVAAVSQSPLFNTIDNAPGRYGKINRLVSLLSSSTYSNQIVSGFVNRLGIEEVENALDLSAESGGDVALSGLKLDMWRDPDLAIVLYEGSVPAAFSEMHHLGLANLIRLAILDMLVENLDGAGANAFPTVSHFLLGYNMKSVPQVEIVEAGSFKGRRSCLHSILDLLRVGTSDDAGRNQVTDADGEVDLDVPLFYRHPKLSERCYRLMYLLCSDEVTSASTMRFLRTTENFFYRQLEAMPVDFVVPILSRGGVMGAETPVVSSTQLHQRAWLMQLIALELHVTTLTGQRSHAQKLLDLLLISPVPDLVKSTPFSHSMTRFDQPLTKMLEILNSLDFNNGDRDQSSRSPQLSYFNDLDTSKFMEVDEYGYTMFDLRAIHGFLLTKQRFLEKQSSSGMVHDSDRVKSEITYILQELLDRNARKENLGSRIHALYGWSLIVRTILGRGYELMPAESREEKIHALLISILPKFNHPNACSDMVEEIAPVILELLYRLREDCAYQAMLQTASLSVESGLKDGGKRDGGNAAQKLKSTVDTLQQTILKGLLDGIAKPDASASVRENLYSALLHYLGYTNPSAEEELEAQAPKGQSLSAYRTSLMIGNLNVISTYGGDKLLEIVCRDAATADRVLKTAAFALLEALCQLAGYLQRGTSSEQLNAIIGFMVKRNFLTGFIGSMVKQEDVAIQALMQSDPGAEYWPSLYIFEAKMSLLLRIAQQKGGVEQLTDAGLIEALTDCKFIDERPDAESDPMDSDKFMFGSTEIYYMTATPVLELLWLVVSYGRENASLIQRVSQFLYNHQEAFVEILKSKNALANPSAMQELELATAIVSYLGNNRQLLEFGIRGSGYTSFHNILISLLMHYMSVEVTGRSSINEENVANERHVQAVCRNLLAYAESVSSSEHGSDEASISLVFSVEAGPKTDKSRISASSALKALSRFIYQYERAADDYRSLSSKASDIQRLGVDEINEIAKRAQVPLIDEYSTLQRQQIALQELKKESIKRSNDVDVLLQIIDHLLLLTWRYFEFCIGTESSVKLDLSNQRYMRGASAAAQNGNGTGAITSNEDAEIGKLRLELNALLEKLADLDLTGQEENRNVFIQMLGRKLRVFC
ncbi:hypothetical protein HDU77_004060 [Chytriomyces hyalinus]|nr:hypothetical protein HDU77_004060 [Chytriomyces hyalinus]